jgi:hypothetical protein
MTEERMRILEMIESGKISAEQGLKLLEALNEHEPDEDEFEIDEKAPELQAGYGEPGAYSTQEPAAERDEAPWRAEHAARALPPEAARWRRFWMIPLWVGVGVTVFSAYWMYRAQVNSSIGWFICASMPFVVGLLLLALAWQSRRGPWLHLRVQQKPGESPQRIAISFPIPIRPTAWFLRTFGHRIPQLQETGADQMIMALGKSTSPDNPLYIRVDEGEDEEKVEIFIG